jgi:hypothetical protein
MGKKDDILKAIENKDDSFIIDYSNKIFENLKELNNKEEKHNLYAVIVVFLYYLMLYKSSIQSLDIGPITINDLSVIAKILPLVFIYIIFNLRTISTHKKDVLFTIKTLSEKMFNEKPFSETNMHLSSNFVSRTYLPYTFSNTVIKIINGKSHIVEALIGFPLLLPVLLIGALPYVITITMLIDLYNNHFNDFLGIASFCLTLWAFLLMIFYIVVNVLKSKAEDNVV